MASECYSKVPLPLYKDVYKDSRDIRVVRLKSTATNKDTLECELLVRRYANTRHYTALSYTWGSAGSLRPMLVNGVEFQVRENLWHFFQEERVNGDGRWFWIDAICIDQSSIVERNDQVPLIGRIYAEADEVHTWLGPKTTNSDVAMKCIRSLTAQGNWVRKTFWTLEEGAAVFDLCQMNYWHRIWIVQELLLATNVLLRCGNQKVQLDDLDSLMTGLQLVQADDRTRGHIYAKEILESAAFPIVEGKRTWIDIQSTNAASALRIFLGKYRYMESTEILDHVYALYGMADHFSVPGDGLSTTVDYSKPAVQVFMELNQHMQSAITMHYWEERFGLIETLRKVLRLAPSDTAVQFAKQDVRDRIRDGRFNGEDFKAVPNDDVPFEIPRQL